MNNEDLQLAAAIENEVISDQQCIIGDSLLNLTPQDWDHYRIKSWKYFCRMTANWDQFSNQIWNQVRNELGNQLEGQMKLLR